MAETSPQQELERLEALAAQMDSAFRIPGTSIRLGYDSLLGLVPGIGDTLALAPAGYILWKARGLGVPNTGLARMIGNVGIDAIIGSIPLIGDIFDVGFKANRRNVALLRKHLERTGKAAPKAKGPRVGTAPSHLSKA